MSTLRRRLDRLAATAPPACPAIEWHDRWHVIYEDVSTGVVPEPPRCAVCGAEGKTIRVTYEQGWRRLNDVPISRTRLEW